MGDLELEAARAEVRRLRETVAAGIDPAEEERKLLTAPTVKDLAERFLAEHASKRSASTQRKPQ